MSSEAEPPDLAALQAMFWLPRTPGEMLSRSPAMNEVVRRTPIELVAVLSGMMTNIQLQPNVARLEMIARAVAARGRGRVELDRPTLRRLLNELAHESHVTRLEDPPEEPFAARIVTRRGEFTHIKGTWEHATFTIETLLDTAEHAPDSEARTLALDEVYALLRISHAIATSAGVTPGVVSNGEPWTAIKAPTAGEQKRLANLVTFSTDRLTSIGVAEASIARFVSEPKSHGRSLKTTPGAAPFDSKPLLRLGATYVVVSPGALVAAIRLRLVEFARTNGIRQFQRVLLNVALHRIDETSFMRLQQHIPAQQVGEFVIKSALMTVEPGRWVHIFAVADSFQPGPILKPAPRQSDVGKLLRQSMRWAHDQAKAHGDYREGLTLIMGCGWGRAMKMSPIRRLPRGWNICAAGCADIATIGNNASGHLIDVWRMLKLTYGMRQRGYEFQNPNGLLNQFGWWLKNGHQMIPEHLKVPVPFGIALPVDALTLPRAAAESQLGARSLATPAGDFSRVLAKNRGHYFEHPARDRQFASIDALRDKLLLGAIDCEPPCWVVVDNETSTASPEWRYQVWEAVLDWTARTLMVLEKERPDLIPDAPFSIQLIVDDPGIQYKEPEDEFDECPPETLKPQYDREGRVLQFTFTPAWCAHLAADSNIAERTLVSTLGQAIAALKNGAIDGDDLAYAVMGGPHARHLHLLAALTARDILGSRSGHRFEPLSGSAECLAKLNLDTLLGEGVTPGRSIEGVEACVDALHKVASNLAVILTNYIRRFDRQTLLAGAVGAAQRATYEEHYWRRSHKAQIGLYGDTPRGREIVFRHGMKINAVRIASRTIAEMAAAQSNSNGRLTPGDADMIELMTSASVLIHAAELSNQIAAGLTPASITFSPGGDILARRDFEEAVQDPLGQKLSDAHVDFALRGPQSNAEPVDNPLNDSDFVNAVTAEYGIGPEQLMQVQEALTKVCLDENQTTLTLRRDELEALLVGGVGVTAESAGFLIDRLLLPIRAKWAKPPPGHKQQDIDPWRFGRRLALTARPFIEVAPKPDQRILCAPILIEEALLFQLTRAYDGQLPQRYWQSGAMRSWSGRAGNRLGAAFNDELASMLRKRGIEARANVQPSALLGMKTPPHLGDADVVAWKPGTTTLWMLEAKDLGLARTSSEVADRLREYSPGQDARGKRSKLQRHLDRVAFVRAHLPYAARLTGFHPTSLRAALVFSSPQPMMFAGIQSDNEDATMVIVDDAAGAILAD
ncbi:MAG: hypothetical protein AB7Q23_10150 [Hyphomonadaceae bacterium]